jgi:hypothetical protein
MTSIQKHIQELIFFYVKTNYTQYLKDNHLSSIPEKNIATVVSELYIDRKEHLKAFIKEGLKKILKDEYPGDLMIINIYTEIFEDDELCKNRIIAEIRLYQEQLKSKKIDHNILLK